MTPSFRGLLTAAATTAGLTSIVAALGGAVGEKDFLTHVDDALRAGREAEGRVFSGGGKNSPILPRVVSASGGNARRNAAASSSARGSATPDAMDEQVAGEERQEKGSQESHRGRSIEAVSARLGNIDSGYLMNDDDDDDADDGVVVAVDATAAATTAAAAIDTYGGLDGGGEEKQTHRVPLENMDNVQYFGQVMIGEPPQLMKILFDTGSSDTWVPGIGCNNCGLHSAFDDMASSTAVSMGRNFTNRYDSGSVEGSVIRDGVVIAGMAVKGVEMGLVRRQEHHIRGFKADGIMGLAFPSISTTRNTSPSRHSTLVQLLQEQFGPVGDMFSVYLTPSPNQPGSVVIFGGYDLDLVRRPRNRRSKSKRQLGGGKDKPTPTPSSSSADPAAEYPAAAASLRGPHAQLRGQEGRPQQQQQQQQQGGDSLEGGDIVGGTGGIAVPKGDGGGWDRGWGLGGGNGVVDGGRGKGDQERIKGQEEQGGGEEGGEEGWRRLKGGGEMGRETGDKGGERPPGVLRYQQQQQQLEDEPVIIWTPVVEYRGSLSYWTVQMTGWRTETAAAATAPVVAEDIDSERSERTGAQRAKVGEELCPMGCQAIVDTGSSLLVPPRNKFRAVIRQITGDRTDCEERHGMVSCSSCTPSEFPDIVISVVVSERPSDSASLQARPGDRRSRSSGGDRGGGVRGVGVGGGAGGGGGTGVISQEFRLKPTDYLSQSWDGCEVLVGEGRATDIWTLGDAFIKTYMTIFDVANLRVGFVCADGGRCLGGAAPPWHDASRLCLPFLGGGVDDDGNDEVGVYCMYLRHDTLACALIVSSVVLFVAGCALWIWEGAVPDDSGGKGGGGTTASAAVTAATATAAPTATVANPLTSFPVSDRSPLVTAAPHPILFGGERDQQREQLSLKGSFCSPLAEESPTGTVAAAIVARGRVGERRSQACLAAGVDRGKREVADRRHVTVDGKNVFLDGVDDESTKHRRERQQGVFSGWKQESKAFLASLGRGARRLSTATAVAAAVAADGQQRSPPPTRSPSVSPSEKRAAERARTSRHFWADDGRTVATAAARQGDGMRSRGGTPRTAATVAAVGNPHHKCVSVSVGID